jgi:dihydroflavonol-4-reductase
MSEIKKVVLTGANGFIGSHLAEYMHNKGFEVHCIVRKSSNLKWIENKGFIFHTCGLEDIEAMKNAFEGAVYIFHLAGTVSGFSYNDYYYGNVTLTENVLSAILLCDKKPDKVLVTSSLAVGGPAKKGQPISEKDGFHPVSMYGKAKVEQERVCQKYKDKLPITIARPSVISGEREVELFQFIETVNNKFVPHVGFSDKYLGIIYITDLLDALYKMTVSEKTAGEAYYLSSETEISWRQVRDICADILGVKPFTLTLPHLVIHLAGHISGWVGKLKGKAPTFDAEKAKEGVQEAWTCSVEKAKQDFGFEQKVSIEEGLRKAIEWYKKEGWL